MPLPILGAIVPAMAEIVGLFAGEAAAGTAAGAIAGEAVAGTAATVAATTGATAGATAGATVGATAGATTAASAAEAIGAGTIDTATIGASQAAKAAIEPAVAAADKAQEAAAATEWAAGVSDPATKRPPAPPSAPATPEQRAKDSGGIFGSRPASEVGGIGRAARSMASAMPTENDPAPPSAPVAREVSWKQKADRSIIKWATGAEPETVPVQEQATAPLGNKTWRAAEAAEQIAASSPAAQSPGGQPGYSATTKAAAAAVGIGAGIKGAGAPAMAAGAAAAGVGFLAGGPVGAAIGAGIVALGVAGKMAAEYLAGFGEEALEAQRPLKEFNASIAQAFAQMEVQEIGLAVRKGEATAASTSMLAGTWMNLQEELQPIKELFANVGNYVAVLATQGARVITFLAKGLLFLDAINDWVKGQKNKDAGKLEGDINRLMHHLSRNEWQKATNQHPGGFPDAKTFMD